MTEQIRLAQSNFVVMEEMMSEYRGANPGLRESLRAKEAQRLTQLAADEVVFTERQVEERGRPAIEVTATLGVAAKGLTAEMTAGGAHSLISAFAVLSARMRALGIVGPVELRLPSGDDVAALMSAAMGTMPTRKTENPDGASIAGIAVRSEN